VQHPTRPRRASEQPACTTQVTLRILASYLALSPASVSLVLNGAAAAQAIPRVTQERIWAASRLFQYCPNSIAQSLRRHRTFTVGVLLPGIGERDASLLVSGIEEGLLAKGYLYYLASHHRRPDLVNTYTTLMLERRVDGLLAFDTPLEYPLHVPVVTIARVPDACEREGVTNIGLNLERAALAALEHLRALGHRRITVMAGPAQAANATAWRRALRDAALRRDVTIHSDPSSQPKDGAPSAGLGYRAARNLLASGAHPTALLAPDDFAAMGAIRALREARLRVPEDVSVVGFGDFSSAAYQDPSLTTVRTPLREMGRRAAQTIVRRVEARRPASCQRVGLDATFIVRKTTGPAARQD
jgi:DNA-binding LacI/PurR family transcriptional regulator